MSSLFKPCGQVVVFLAVFSLYCASTLAAPPRAPLDLEVRWRAGAHVDYLLVKTGLVRVGGVVKVNTSNTTPVHVEVESANLEGYVLAWTAGETHFDEGAAASMSPLMKRMAGIMAGHKLLLRLDRHGRLLEVVNWQAIRQIGNTMASEIGTLLLQSGMRSDQAAQTVTKFKAMFASEELVRQIATREPQLLLLMLGRRYDRTHPTEFSETVPNPTGDGQISAIEHVELRDNPRAVTLEWLQTPASSSSADGGGASVKGHGEYDVTTGWPNSVAQIVSATVGDSERKETTSLSLR